MPKYMVSIREVSPSDVPLDEGSHSTKQYRPPTRDDKLKFCALVTPTGTTEYAILEAAILSAIGTAES